MSTTAKTILIYTLMVAACAAMLMYPDSAFAQAGGAIRAKIDQGRESYALPIAIGIMACGAIASVVLWALDVMDWKGMAKWLLAAIIVGSIAGGIIEMAS